MGSERGYEGSGGSSDGTSGGEIGLRTRVFLRMVCLVIRLEGNRVEAIESFEADRPLPGIGAVVVGANETVAATASGARAATIREAIFIAG